MSNIFAKLRNGFKNMRGWKMTPKQCNLYRGKNYIKTQNNQVIQEKKKNLQNSLQHFAIIH